MSTEPTLLAGDCLERLRALPDASVHAVVTDPPYGLANTTPAQVADTVGRWVAGERDHVPAGRGFMGKPWDAFVPPPAVWDECLRVLTPGGHLLAFAGSRTVDLMGLSIRLAGFDLRDGLVWLYGSGFPKSLDVSKAVDAHLTSGGSGPTHRRRRDMGEDYAPHPLAGTPGYGDGGVYTPGELGAPGVLTGRETTDRPLQTQDAAAWRGWGTSLKPSHEPMVLARKPLEGTVAASVLEHGTGALNVDATRTGMSEGDAQRIERMGGFGAAGYTRPRTEGTFMSGTPTATESVAHPGGRWPANVLLDGHAANEVDRQGGYTASAAQNMELPTRPGFSGQTYGDVTAPSASSVRGHTDSGGASRFFPVFRYEPKAPPAERPVVDGVAHPTVKPLALMRWLVRLLTPPGGTVLDPFMGSGTTVEAALAEGFRVVGVEREPTYLPLVRARVERQHQRVQRAATQLGAEPLFDLPPQPGEGDWQ